MALDLVKNRILSLVTGVTSSKRFGLSSEFQSGSSSLRADGSITLPLTIWSPISPAFSKRSTRKSSLPASLASCFSRMAALRPAGPPPTIQTSTSSDSRSARSCPDGSSTLTSRLRGVVAKDLRWPAVIEAGRYRRTPHVDNVRAGMALDVERRHWLVLNACRNELVYPTRVANILAYGVLALGWRYEALLELREDERVESSRGNCPTQSRRIRLARIARPGFAAVPSLLPHHYFLATSRLVRPPQTIHNRCTTYSAASFSGRPSRARLYSLARRLFCDFRAISGPRVLDRTGSLALHYNNISTAHTGQPWRRQPLRP